MEIKQAYEVYSLIGGGYNKRQVHGYAWTKEGADIVGGRSTDARYHVGSVHLAKVNNQWHRINVFPVEFVYGDETGAKTSHVGVNPDARRTPAMFVVAEDGQQPFRLTHDLEKAINIIAGVRSEAMLKLYTYRVGGAAPLNFTRTQLMEDPKIQEKIVRWLNYEIEARK